MKRLITADKLASVAVVFDEYQNNLAKLFTETGDTLSIPKILFMHGDHQTEAFFGRQLEAAAKKATNSTHAVHGVSSELLTKNSFDGANDTVSTPSLTAPI